VNIAMRLCCGFSEFCFSFTKSPSLFPGLGDWN